jgi:hypothetical protein
MSGLTLEGNTSLTQPIPDPTRESESTPQRTSPSREGARAVAVGGASPVPSCNEGVASSGLTQLMSEMMLEGSTSTQSTSDPTRESGGAPLWTSPSREGTRSLAVGSACPVPGCNERVAFTRMIHHLERHSAGICPGEVPPTWLTEKRKYICACSKILSETSRNSHQSKCTAAPLPQRETNPELPSLEEVFRLQRPTLKHIPAAARQIWARVLQDAIKQAIQQNDVEAYTLLFMLPKCVLPSAKRAGKKAHRVDIVTLCNRWAQGERLELWDEACRSAAKKSNLGRKSDDETDKQRVRQAAIAFAEDGLFGKACRVLSSKGLAPNSQETLRLLKEKHPSQPSPTCHEVPTEVLRLPADFNLREILRSFPRGTACGPSGLRADHLAEAAESTLPTTFLSTLLRFVNHLIAAKAPEEVAPYMAGASLIALQKSDPGKPLDIRPIAVGEIYRRLTGKCVCVATVEKARERLQPHQVGVACPAGVERAVHATRSLIKDHWEDDDFAILKVDMRNAFNTVSRQEVVDQCALHLPEIVPWVLYCYKSHPRLWHVLGSLWSAAGVQQGDPLGPVIFALALHRLVIRLDDVEGPIMNSWYLDDGILAGSRKALLECLGIIEEAREWSGLEINLGKCWVFSRSDVSAFPTAVKKSDVPNLEVLGAPIGDDHFCEEFVANKANEAGTLLNQLPELQDSQVSLALLRQCGGFCKLAHLTRCCPSEQVGKPLGAFDDAVMGCLEEVCGVELTPRARQQAQLGLGSGGLGLRSLELHAPGAYIASVAGCTSTEVNLEEEINRFNSRTLPTDRIADNQIPNKYKKQGALSSAIDKKSAADLDAESPSEAETARLHAVAAPSTGVWMSAVPSPGLGLRLDNDEVQTLVKLRLGLPLATEGATCALCPEKTLDPLGHHALTCRRGPDVITRHNSLRNTLFDSCRRALLNPILEQGASLGDSGSQTRPADILIPVWSLGKAGAIDVTVAHPLNSVFIPGASAASSDCLDAAELRKHTENDGKCADLRWECLPVAVTAYGCWGREAEKTLRKISSRLAIQTKQPGAQTHRELLTRLGVVLARSTARAIIARSTHSLDDV